MVTDQINGNNFLRYSLIMSEIPGGLSMPRFTGDGSESVKWEKKKVEHTQTGHISSCHC